MKECMMKLCHPKTGILQKENKKPVFKADEKISINTKFQSPNIKIMYLPIIKPVDLASGKCGSKSFDELDTEV